MMCKTKGNKLGLVLGLLLGLGHLGWVVLVAVGVAQSFMDWIFGLHFITPVYIITTFSWNKSVALVLFTFVVGYVIGWVVSLLCKLVCGCCCKGASQSNQSGCCSKD